MTDLWTDRLSEYLDGELESAERLELERHLASCGACATALEDLREVAARAASLPVRPPASDLWTGIEPRLDPVNGVVTPFQARVTRRVSFTLPQLVAAGLALMVMSGGGVWVLEYGGRRTDMPRVGAASDANPAATADPRYDETIAALEHVLAAGRSQLDPGALRVLESNLQATDQAIDQTRRALAADSGNVYLRGHLAEMRQRKLALLRDAVELLNGKSRR